MFCVFSSIGPHTEQRSENCGLKVSGFFVTANEAKKHVLRLHELDPLVDRLIAPVNEWIVTPLNRSQIADSEYQETQIEKIKKSIKQRNVEGMKAFADRKEKLLRGEMEPSEGMKVESKPLPPVSEVDEMQNDNNAILSDQVDCPGQTHAVISIDWVDPNPEHFLVRFESYHSSLTEASDSAEEAQKRDATHDRYVVEMYRWVALPPDSSQIENITYTDEKLDEIMKGYKKNQKDAASMLESRTEGSLGELDVSDKNSIFYSKNDTKPVSHPADHLDRLRAENPDATTEDIVKMADKIVEEEIKARERALAKGKGKALM